MADGDNQTKSIVVGEGESSEVMEKDSLVCYESSKSQQEEGFPPDESEVVESIDASPQQEDVIILNLDFEEMAKAVFGQLDLVDQIIAGDLDPPSDRRDEESIETIRTVPVSETRSSAQQNAHVDAQNSEKLVEKGKSGKSKEKNRDSGRVKTKEDKSIEHILRALNSLHTTEEKLAALCKKYADLMEEHRNLQLTLKQSERKTLQVVREKEQLQTEHSKAILTRSRLESLCRELQRQNKVVKDESLMRVREEEEKRKEVSAKFQTTFNEISNMMQDNNQKSSKLREENLELAQKLKSLVEQYEMREQQVENLVKHKEIEAQLAEAKLAKANVMMNEEREKYVQEKHKMLVDLTDYQKKCHEMTSNEVRLRTQLNLYTEKYEEFQSTITKSNDVFTHFKDEMDKMSKKIKKLEKETGSWRTRWENSNKALLEMAADKQRHDSDLSNADKKVQQLEKLCRALQLERQNLLAQLKAGGDNEVESRTGDALSVESNEVVDGINEKINDKTHEERPTTKNVQNSEETKVKANRKKKSAKHN